MRAKTIKCLVGLAFAAVPQWSLLRFQWRVKVNPPPLTPHTHNHCNTEYSECDNVSWNVSMCVIWMDENQRRLKSGYFSLLLLFSNCILHYILLYILFKWCLLFVQIKFIQNCQTYNHNPWRSHAALTIHLFTPTHPHVESFDLETDGGFQKGISKPMGFGPMTLSIFIQTQWFKIVLCSCKPRRCCFAPPSSQMSLNSIDIAPNSFL